MVQRNIVIVIVLVIVAILAVLGFWYRQQLGRSKTSPTPAVEKVEESQVLLEKQAEQSAIEVPESPVEGKIPELNPVEKINPFKKYQNPFE